MSERELCIIEGDGIGHEVVPAAIEVLRQVVPDLNIHQAQAGWNCFEKRGQALPEETIELAKKCKAVLYGAANSPSYPVDGYFSPIVRLRRIMMTHANLRPTYYLPVPTARPGVDLLVVRENTEDLYVSEEYSEADGDTGTARKVITRAASERISHTAFELAVRADRRRVTIVHKGNIMPQTDGLFRRVAYQVAEHYPEIEVDDLLVDTAAYWMVKEPTRFDVVLTPNLYGDILSDMAAAWGGGLGMASSLNLGDDVAIAEPVHGAAPDIAGRGIANPTAMILSAALLVRYHWKMPEAAERIEHAVHAALSEGAHTADIVVDNAMTTMDFTHRVMEHL